MEKKKILIFGGTGFIGAEVVECLLNNNSDYDITLVNRGHWKDWDLDSRIKSRLTKFIICDREKEYLKDFLDIENFDYDYVIDFSAYKSKSIRNSLKGVPTEKIKMYILISTDSVYEVSDFSQDQKSEDGYYYIKETDSIRPSSENERTRLKKFDSYGHHKFKLFF